MMKKLYKWDLIHYINQLKWVFLGTIFMVILSEIFKTFMDTNFVWALFYQTAFIVSIVGIIVMVIYALFAVFQRFYQTMLKDEAYFTHTLPMSKSKILLSKVLSGYTLFFVSLLVALGLFIQIDVISVNDFLDLRTLDPNSFNIAVLSIVSMVIMFFVFIVVIYAAMTFGFSFNKREWLYVFVYFILYYLANQVVSMINLGINLLINPKLFEVEPENIFSAISGILILQLVFSVGLGVLNYFIARYFISHKLNLKNG